LRQKSCPWWWFLLSLFFVFCIIIQGNGMQIEEGEIFLRWQKEKWKRREILAKEKQSEGLLKYDTCPLCLYIYPARNHLPRMAFSTHHSRYQPHLSITTRKEGASILYITKFQKEKKNRKVRNFISHLRKQWCGRVQGAKRDPCKSGLWTLESSGVSTDEQFSV